MELVKLFGGLVLLGLAGFAQIDLAHRMRPWPIAYRLRVVGPTLLVLVAYFAVAWSQEGVSTWWILPFGTAGAALFELGLYRLVRGRSPA